MASSDAPVSIAKTALRVRDLDLVGDFYQRVLGLSRLSRNGEVGLYGAGDTVLLELRQDRAAKTMPHEAGLFHNAFLLPQQHDLGNWLDHAAGQGVRLDGASDHLVSEALYLRDPEGNGIEIYWDRDRDQWATNGDQILMDTRPLDLEGLPRKGRWQGMPEAGVIGHVHLQVGDLGQSHPFFTDDLGMVQTFSLPTARWYGSGGYHHHLAGNIWNSAGAGQRTQGAAGLDEVELLVKGAGRNAELYDPFGTRFTFRHG